MLELDIRNICISVIINNLEKNGHEVEVAARGKDITLHLLNVDGFDYEVVGKTIEHGQKSIWFT